MKKLHVKYMVSLRCKMLVKSELEKLGLRYVSVDLGIIEILENITSDQHEQLKINLKKSGLELLDDKRSQLVEKTKMVINEMIRLTDNEQNVNYSEYISRYTGYEYTHLAHVFSEITGVTVQQFIIVNKVDRVKELLLYNHLTIKEIAYRLHYSSTAHLSNQFKKITGLTPAYFKGIAQKRKYILDNL
jgi:AraC-like DNA-binding protein